MQIAILLYPGFTATDAIGPYEVLSRLPGARTVFVAATPGPVTSDTGFLQVLAEPLSAAPAPAVVVAPGGPTARVPTGDVVVLDWLRAADRTSTWTTSVCTGALLLGAAGPPLALFCLGATLPKPEGWKGMAGVAAASALKLLAMPALVAAIAWAAGVEGVAFAVVVLAAAMPTGANAFLLARRFHTMMEASASTVVASTALALVTLTLLLGWLK